MFLKKVASLIVAIVVEALFLVFELTLNIVIFPILALSTITRNAMLLTLIKKDKTILEYLFDIQTRRIRLQTQFSKKMCEMIENGTKFLDY